ncbi:MAG TPA: outer membrane beta-barrel protein [Chitinophaga sp.]
MKKIVLSGLFSFGVLLTYAQTSLGVLGGLNIASQSQDKPLPGVFRKATTLWHAGLAADVKLTRNFYLQPQLLVTAKGSKTQIRDVMDPAIGSVYNASSKIQLLYLELPLNVVCKFRLGPGKLLAGAGPYAAYGVGGKSTANFYMNNGAVLSYQYDVKFRDKAGPETDESGKSYLYYQPVDFGVNFITGYELKNGLAINFNYSVGLTDIATWSSTVKNRYFGVTGGYFLKKRH